MTALTIPTNPILVVRESVNAVRIKDLAKPIQHIRPPGDVQREFGFIHGFINRLMKLQNGTLAEEHTQEELTA